MVDMSTTADTSMDIFEAIMDNGPLTLYSANNKTRIPVGTIHRHFKQLTRTGKIRVYASSSKGRKKIEYGPYHVRDCKLLQSIQKVCREN